MMQISTYDIIYLISNSFGTFVIFKYMNIFFNREEINKKIEIVSYILYYIIIAIIYLTFNSSTINLISNLIMFFLLTLNYRSRLKLKLIATVIIYAILICIEALVVFGLQILKLNRLSSMDIELILALICTKMVEYLLMLVLTNFKMIKHGRNIPFSHWLAVFIVPIVTLISTFILITKTTNDAYYIIFGVLSFFFINIFVFYLYNYLIMSYEQKAKEIQLEQEMKAYSEQLSIMNESQKRIQIIRHDTRHHLAMLQSLIKNEKALQYVNTAFDFINYSNEYAKSGNAEINTILNYKLNQAHELDIKVNLALSVPDELVVQPFDLSIILGNLLDNAIRATSRLKEKELKRIDIQIEYDRNIIYIFITNPFDGKIIYCDGKYETTQTDNDNHALGLGSVKNSIEKYNGEISFSHEDNLFRVSALFYDSADSLCG